MRPTTALEATGKRPTWVAEQMSIHRSYLWRLLMGERAWTPELRKRFALALGLAEEAIDFATEVDAESPDSNLVANNDTPTPRNGA